MLYNQLDWIMEHLEHVLEKGSANRWESMREQKQDQRGNDVRFTWSGLKMIV